MNDTKEIADIQTERPSSEDISLTELLTGTIKKEYDLKEEKDKKLSVKLNIPKE